MLSGEAREWWAVNFAVGSAFQVYKCQNYSLSLIYALFSFDEFAVLNTPNSYGAIFYLDFRLHYFIPALLHSNS